MKHTIYLLAFTFVFLFITNCAVAQGMSVNSTGAVANSSAILDASSTTQGVLVPRMTTTQRTGISSPAKGLLVYDSTLASFYYNSGTPASPSWTSLGGSSLPTGTMGAILYYNGSSWTGLPAGTSGQVLVMSSGVPAWAPTTTLTIGQSYGGGKIAYLLQSGDPGYDPTVQHGLIAATSDQSTGVAWNPSGGLSFSAAGGTGIGTGKVNTDNILNETNYSGTAAEAARYYTGGGFNDWYLPSKDELNELYINRVAIGGFASAWYWSSSEYDNNYAWNEYFSGGFQDYGVKAAAGYVRAVRAF